MKNVYDGICPEDILRMEQESEPNCPDCGGLGIVDVDTGGGNSEERYCECSIGQALLDHDEAARDEYMDCKIDAYMDKKRGI